MQSCMMSVKGYDQILQPKGEGSVMKKMETETKIIKNDLLKEPHVPYHTLGKLLNNKIILTSRDSETTTKEVTVILSSQDNLNLRKWELGQDELKENEKRHEEKRSDFEEYILHDCQERDIWTKENWDEVMRSVVCSDQHKNNQMIREKALSNYKTIQKHLDDEVRVGGIPYDIERLNIERNTIRQILEEATGKDIKDL